MLTKKEIFTILTITLVLGIVIALLKLEFPLIPSKYLSTLGTSFLIIFLVIMVNILTKKVIAFYLDSEIEIKMWEFRRWGLQPHQQLRKPFPAGIIIPLLIKFISIQMINWFACMTFEAKGKIYRAARRHGIYSHKEISEYETGWIAIGGIIANLIFAFLGFLIGQEEFGKINAQYAFFNMLPISNLDGSKIFFGVRKTWFALFIITALVLIMSFGF